MNQDFLNENKEEQKTEQAPTQTENKETAPQAVPADAVEEKKSVQEDEKEVSSQSEHWQGQRPPYQPPYNQQPYQGNQQQPFYPYGAPQYPMYPQPNTGSNGLAIASLILGIVSLVLVAAFSWMLWGSIAGLCLGIVGTILGVMGRKNATGRTMATAGMILSIIGIAIGAICFISCFTYYITYASYRYYWY